MKNSVMQSVTNALLIGGLGSLFLAATFADENPVEGLINFETPHVHPLERTSGGLVLAVNTPAATLEVFQAVTGGLQHLRSVPVGLDPVSVRARNAAEAWVVNHVSDSISVVDLATGATLATLATGNEPADVVFAGTPLRAFVSCSETNEVWVFNPSDLNAPPQVIAIDAEEPRAMAVSPDGLEVYVALFESGNRTTVLNGRTGPISTGEGLGAEDVVSRPEGPYGGQNPAPNAGNGFSPPKNNANGAAPRSSIIVRKNNANQWRDDNNGDWSIFVSGALASTTRRTSGWDLLDRDVAVINTQTLAVSYQSGLMNIVMGIAANPASGEVTTIGTDALNEVRFEPNLNGVFLRVNLARFNPGASATVLDLNPHLDYSVSNIPEAERAQSLGDPRSIVWRANGQRAFVAGMGSNNVIEIDAFGQRVRHIDVGQGPTGVVLNESAGVGYALNRFEGSISTFGLSGGQGVLSETTFFDPTPSVIQAGRVLLYDTHLTSGLGHASCASCHVDARTDRLSWDLGDPTGGFDANNHPMKGPMVTQSLQDIIGHPNMHWRGDRAALQSFNPAFVSLMGADAPFSGAQMSDFESFLDTIHFPPNPARGIDNSRPSSLLLPDGRVAPVGNALRNSGCLTCHLDGQTRANERNSELSQNFIPPTFHGFYDKIGYFPNLTTGALSGTGFFHDGADPLFVAARGPNFLAEIMTIEGPDGILQGGELRQDVHAGVGQQVTLNGPASGVESSRFNQFLSIASSNSHVALIAKGLVGGQVRGYSGDGGTFQSDRAGETISPAALRALAEGGSPVTFTLVAQGTQQRLGIDLDLDGELDGDENSAPSLVAPGDQSNVVGDSVSLSIEASDPDGDTLVYAASGLPASLAINSSTGLISGVLGAGSAGSYTVQISVSDGNGADVAVDVNWFVSPGGSTTTFEKRIAAGSDDVEQRESGSVLTSSSDLELTQDQGQQTIGLRFTGLTIPAGANIVSAHVQFQADENTSVATSLSVRARAVDNAPAFGTASGSLSGLALTSASVGWNPAAWTTGSAGAAQRTPELRTVVAEVMSRPGWSSGQALSFVITGSGERVAESFEGLPSAAAQLHVEYSGTGGGSPPAATSPGNQASQLGDAVALIVDAFDPAGLALTYSASGLPPGLSIGSASGMIVGTLGSGAAGQYSPTVVVANSAGGSVSLPFVWNVSSGGGQSLDLRVAAGADDVEERENGDMYRTSSDLEMTLDGGGSQTIGLRFLSLPIPQGAPITNAYVQFTADEQTGVATNLTLRGVDQNSAPAFGSSDGFVSDLPLTSASSSWSPGPWTAQGAAGTGQRTTNLSALIQEIVDRSGWSAGNDLALVLSGTGERVAVAYDGQPAQAPLLHVEYGGGGSNGLPSLSNPGPLSSAVGSFASVSLSASDPEGEPLVYSGAGLPSGLTVEASTGLVSGTTDVPGVYPARFSVNDGHGISVSVNTTWTVGGGGSSTVDVRVAASNDDAEQQADLSMDRTSSDLELTFDGGVQTIGLRFNGLGIPQGATILSAHVQFTTDETTSQSTSLTLRGHDADNSGAFPNTSGYLSSLPTTAAAATWNPPAWSTAGQAGPAQRTADLAAIVQEIVNRSGWSPSSSLALIITGSGERVAVSYNGEPAQAPLLHVEFAP